MVTPEKGSSLTTYLNTDEQIAEWLEVCDHFPDIQKVSDLLRELIRLKAMDISHGATRRQAGQKMADAVALLLRQQAMILELLGAKNETDDDTERDGSVPKVHLARLPDRDDRGGDGVVVPAGEGGDLTGADIPVAGGD